MILYHGSKNGIQGAIKPDAGRTACDFGNGFYMGDKPEQPKGLIAPYPNHMFYELECDFEGLRQKEFTSNYESQIDWALYIAYNRQIIDFAGYPDLQKKYQTYNTSYDVIIGLIEALQHVRLGRQYVLKTAKSCTGRYIRITKSTTLSEKEKKSIIAENTNRITRMQGLLNQIQTKYRRAQNIKFFDEIIEEWNQP